ncbi:hypothetical protein FT663_00042 [Candidozyma haemuli var. vulneris]|nr:hypothetical protein FT662_00208 [[Candida] haemuloni var. vulneris]KAF3995819.1 hypothetical protein FT663_00042 [[Candida] haemuloni var. vulneris]
MPMLPDGTGVVSVFSTNIDWENGLSVVVNWPWGFVPVTQIIVGLVEDDDDDDEDDVEVVVAARAPAMKAISQMKRRNTMTEWILLKMEKYEDDREDAKSPNAPSEMGPSCYL